VPHDVYTLPKGLPVPKDDGAADHLVGLELPSLALQSSAGEVDVRDFDVIYIYPRSGRPGQAMLPGRPGRPEIGRASCRERV